jgi:hypothetical protein
MADSFAGVIVGLDAVGMRKASERIVVAFVARMRSGV